MNEADCAFAANKFTLTWNTAGSSREFIYLAAGDNPAAGATSLIYQPAPSSSYLR